MSRTKVFILGRSGMLGSMVNKVFYPSEFYIGTSSRKHLYAGIATVEDIVKVIDGYDWVINCIGKIKPYIDETNPKSVENAVLVNTLFPYYLQEAAQAVNAKVIQIATDCVFSGEDGHYSESDPHDAHDIYGKTKSLGEAMGDNFYNLRCSIIGPEIKNHSSLMDWFLGQPKGAEVNGFMNHQWNGLTTLAFARICQGIIKNDIDLPNIVHIVPGSSISKWGLLTGLADNFDRQDITINRVEAPLVINRTLSTLNWTANVQLWRAAGYDDPVTVGEMIKELAEYQ